jgi:hypothetical protein
MKLILLPSILVEVTGDTLLLLNQETSDVLALPAREVTYRAHPRPLIEIAEGAEDTARELRLRGFVGALGPDGPARVTRRLVVQGAASVAGAGAVSLALPGVAAASSVGLRTGEWTWERQTFPGVMYNIYVYLSEETVPEVTLATWSYDAGRWTIELDFNGTTATATEYDDPPPVWEWYASGPNGVIADPGLSYLEDMDVNNPYVISGVLKENGSTIANLELTFRSDG